MSDEENPVVSAKGRWLQRRLSGVGSSEAAAAIGENPYDSPLALWGRKRGLLPPREYTERMEWGERLEPAIAAKFTELTGRRIRNIGKRRICRHVEYSWMIATLDRLQDEPKQQGSGVLEIKNVSAYMRNEWSNGIPRLYWVQVQHQLAVTGLTWGSLAVLVGGQEFRWVDVQRDDEFIADRLIPRERAFWQCVLGGREPSAVDEADATRKALRQLHPVGNGTTVTLPPEAEGWDEDREIINRQLDDLLAEKGRLTNRIKQAIGDANEGRLPSGVYYKLIGKLRTIKRGVTNE